ncbi:hypothetical protein EW146_g8974 [Bondarzewia mesenterica]|uniref:Uncharacterized protein n=1 Tax=Bondarzewia mesenterica TaxID=1095465 RepID=A0A4S4LFF8_9AGAM|nr:hypothetical protein EW146_g8974 [Bondarzewia mesenterica]
MSGRILDEEARKVVESMKSEVTGRYGMRQCDGWKNIQRTSLVGSMVNIEYKPHILNLYDISSEAKTAVNLLKIIEQEIDYCVQELMIIMIAYCTDSSGEAAKMRRLLGKKCPSIAVVPCWAHQVNLIIGDYFKGIPNLKAIGNNALEVVKWFNNHGRAIGILKDLQRVLSPDGKFLCLILPSIFVRAVADHDQQLEKDCIGNDRKARAKAKKVMQIIKETSFWMRLRVIKQCLEPLAVAANITQSDHARLDVIMAAIVNLYWIFSRPSIDSNVSVAVIASLNKRWKQTDQELFIIAVLLNPYFRRAPFQNGSPFRSFTTLWAIFCRAFMQFFGEQPDLECRKAFNLWREHDTKASNGANSIVHLALVVLSIVPNSASTECLFSDFGIIHNKLRNRLHPEHHASDSDSDTENYCPDTFAASSTPASSHDLILPAARFHPAPLLSASMDMMATEDDGDSGSDDDGESGPGLFDAVVEELIRDVVDVDGEEEVLPAREEVSEQGYERSDLLIRNLFMLPATGVAIEPSLEYIFSI